MADYVLPSVVEKRVRYFDGQFLQDQDFIDEQDYQLDRERRHNRLLHGPGITEGLTVTSAASNQVTVAAGSAIDSDGRQLVLAQATTVDLPGADFNDKQGVELLISYLESAEDQQTEEGIEDFTRWLERPTLTPLAPNDTYSGAMPPVLLAKLTLDSAGRVAVDATVRPYSGLRLPGAAPDAVTLSATSGGPVHVTGSLTVDGNVGIGTTSPQARLEVLGGGGQSIDLLVNGQLRSNSNNGGLWASTDRFIGGDGGTGLGLYNGGAWRLFVASGGNVGIGTTSPGACLEVVGAGGMSVDLEVNGRLRSNSNDGGLWVASDRFIGGFDTDRVGIYNGGAWRVAVQPSGSVGINTTNTGGYTLCVGGQSWLQGDTYIQGTLNYYSAPDGWRTIVNRATTLTFGAAAGAGPSDIRLKTDLRPIGDALDLVRKLQGVRYRWNDTGLAHFTRDIESSVSAGPDATPEQHTEARQAERRRALDQLAGDRLGLIAQDVESIVPELVQEGEDGYKQIRYQHLTALLTEAIKEQDAVVQALTSEVTALRAALSGPLA